MPITSDELDKLVAEANFTVRLDPDTRQDRTFRTFQEVKDFFQEELSFWSSHGGLLANIHGNFGFVVNALNQAVTAHDLGSARNQIDEAVKRVKQQANMFVYSQAPLAGFLNILSEKHPELAKAAARYSTEGPRNGNRQDLEGAFAWATFRYPDLFSAGLDSHVQAFTDQASRVSELREKIAEQSKTFQDETEKWLDTTENSVAGKIQTAEAAFSEVRKNGEEAFSKTNDEWVQKFDEAFNAWGGDLAAIKAANDEQMKLQEPADYWKELEKEYDAKGYRWVKVAAALVGGLVLAVAALVYQPPGLFTEAAATLGGIKGALLIAAGVSMVVYLITLFVRFATSSYHLARDARERLQLTHVFLALIKKAAIEQKDRDVILPSLFSRADTGLLKGDSGPSFPTPLQAVIDASKK